MGCSSSVAAIRLNHSASPVQEVSPMDCCLAQIVAIILGRFVFIPYRGYMIGFLLLGYVYLYLLLLGYIAICLYIYIGIVLFFYSFIACLQHWCITFFISIFYFCLLTSTSIFYDSGCRLSIIWLFTVQRYGGSVRYQTLGDALFG